VTNTDTAAIAASVMFAMSTEAATTFAKRTVAGRAAKTINGCEVQPMGYGPMPTLDTADAFIDDQDFTSTASSPPCHNATASAFPISKRRPS
jgi:hypothetical protein